MKDKKINYKYIVISNMFTFLKIMDFIRTEFQYLDNAVALFAEIERQQALKCIPYSEVGFEFNFRKVLSIWDKLDESDKKYILDMLRNNQLYMRYY